MSEPSFGDHGLKLRVLGLAGAAAALVAMWAVQGPADLSGQGWMVVCLAVMMAVLWMTEAIPIPATALLPLVLLPLTGVCSIREAAAPFADPVIYLFMGGFLLSLSMERWGLHKRLALAVLSRVGSRPQAILAGFMVASAGLSMWISNAATTLMMLPIAISIVAVLGGINAGAVKGFAPPLVLAIAYSASIGGLGTPVGTPPNAFLVGHLRGEYGIEVGFGHFMALGFPVLFLALPIVFVVLTRVCFRVPSVEIQGAETILAAERAALGRMSRGEVATAVVFVLAATLWVIRPLLKDVAPMIFRLGDEGVAMLAGVLLFMIPVSVRRGEYVMNWDTAVKLPWGVLILFGGGLTLARQMEISGVAAWVGAKAAPLADLPPWLAVTLVCLVVIFLTELTSNTATAASLVPIAASVSVGMGQSPMLLALPVCLAASCAFMLPVATPPNAIVFGSGQVTLPQMVRAGLWLNLCLVVVLSLVVILLAPLVFPS
jgi:sodium-dependent dicarboxylate transporter 2/3/5